MFIIMITIVPYVIYGFVNARANIHKPRKNVTRDAKGWYKDQWIPREVFSYVGRVMVWMWLWLPLFFVNLAVNGSRSKYVSGGWKWL